MLNSRTFYNSRPDGFGVLEIADDSSTDRQQFVPLKRTHLTGTITGPLANLTLTQTFALPEQSDAVIESLYRFPLPGDAAVMGVRVRFGVVEIQTVLKERTLAEEEYQEAKKSGRQAALLTRESPDVFTLAVAGIRAGEEIVVSTEYVQLARAEGKGWSLRVPLTTAPRFVRSDEANSRHAGGQPLAIRRDPGHRFSLDLTFSNAHQVASTTHALATEAGHVRLRDGEVLPDRDCIVTWQQKAGDRPTLSVWTHTDLASVKEYFLALCSPPTDANATNVKKIPREVILLVDHSGSMEGPKWEAADWAVERFLAGLSEQDSFALGLFHDTTQWFAERPQKATRDAVRNAVAFLRSHRDSGGTQLGVALEQALDRPRAAESPSRHVLILTDAEVSDNGRILRLAEQESEKTDRRRISVLCIDSAPNEALASELAERGGGVSRFLTSNPDEDDVTTALDEVLADWSAPVLTSLTLEVNRAVAEAAGRLVSLITPGPASGIDIGDLPAGRPVWVIGRVPQGSEPLSFRLHSNSVFLSEQTVEVKNIGVPSLKTLFAADRIRKLEYVMTANFAGEELRTELSRLGYDISSPADAKVDAESIDEASAKMVREILVRESLAGGVPCSETAFIAVRTEAGQVVTETRIVANAQPQGWKGDVDVLAAGGSGPPSTTTRMLFSGLGSAPVDTVDSMLCEFDDDDSEFSMDFDPLEAQHNINLPPAMPPGMTGLSSAAMQFDAGLAQRLRSISVRSASAGTKSIGGKVEVSVAPGQFTASDGAVLYNSPNGNAGQFTYLSVSFVDKAITADSLNPELMLLLFMGDLAAPRARVKLADVLRQGGRRPLNLRCDAGDPVRLTLADPESAWNGGVPAMEIVLGWKE